MEKTRTPVKNNLKEDHEEPHPEQVFGHIRVSGRNL